MKSCREAVDVSLGSDPVTLALVHHRLTSVAWEMGEAMLRTAYSQILNASRDFSVAICDVRTRLVAQADHIPIHVGALSWAVKAVENRFDDIADGDVFLLNDPYAGGSHLPDVTALLPVVWGGRRLLWVVVRAHMSDIGGATHGAYNPQATEIWQEGLRIPPIRLCEAGRQRDDLLDMLALNVRFPRDFRGDLAAMVGAARLGDLRLRRLLGEIGRDTVLSAIDAILASAERRTRSIVGTWQPGTYYGEATLDDDGHGRRDIKIRASVKVADGRVAVDLGASDPQTTSFANSSYANTRAAVAMAFAYLLDADIPKNDGVFRVLDVAARQGTIVWPHDNAAVTLCTTHPGGGLSRPSHGRLEPPLPYLARGRRPAERQALHLAHVPRAAGGRGIARRRRMVGDG